MDYQKIYNNIILRGQTRILEGYKEKHHIIPRCMGGTNDADNIVSLTPEEHYVCHLLLVKIFPNHFGLVKSAIFMTTNNNEYHQRNNKLYGWLKRQYSTSITGPNNPNYNGLSRRKYIEKYGIPQVSKDYITDNWRNQISERMKGDKNPISGIKPWKHPRTTDVTLALWKRADAIYDTWVAHDMPSYCKLFGLVMDKKYDWQNKNHGKEIGTFMNMVKYFRNGWVPTQDIEWNKL